MDRQGQTMDVDQPNAERRFAVAAGRVFTGEDVLADHAVLLEAGTVSAVVPTHELPPGVQVVEEPDATLIPGLIDTHTHFMRWQGPLFLAHGVTTIRDTGNDGQWILAQRDVWSRNPWPRILCVGPVLDGPRPTHPLVSRACADCADAVSAVCETAGLGVDGIKLYVGLHNDWLAPMTDQAHARGLKACMHCQGGGVRAAVKAGVDEFFHLDGVVTEVWSGHPPGWLNLWGAPGFSATWDLQQALADDIGRSGMTATPTLAYWESQRRVREPGFRQDSATCRVPELLVEWQGSAAPNPAHASEWGRALEAAQRFTGLLLERGVRVLAGSDVPCGALPPGLSLGVDRIRT